MVEMMEEDTDHCLIPESRSSFSKNQQQSVNFCSLEVFFSWGP